MIAAALVSGKDGMKKLICHSQSIAWIHEAIVDV